MWLEIIKNNKLTQKEQMDPMLKIKGRQCLKTDPNTLIWWPVGIVVFTNIAGLSQITYSIINSDSFRQNTTPEILTLLFLF